MSFENLSGQMLGSYELRELLGQGGMGAVYRAVQANLKRDVAIKILPTALAQQSGYLERFNREAEIAAALQHPHIVPIIDYGMQRGISYVVMRLLTGGSLAQRINQRLIDNGSLPSLGEAAHMLNQLASALDYAHSQGVIHRDIKTSNIMFDNQGNAYIVDFGIAKLQGANQNLTSTGVTLGTSAYMPPEQWRSEVLTAAADQYAMAIAMYILLTGRIPYESDTPGGLMYKHFNEIPVPPQQFRADLPASVSDVINRALAKRPEDRYPNMTAFANAFQKAIAGYEGEPNGFFTFKIRGIPLPAPITPPSPPLGVPTVSITPSDDSSTVVQPTTPPIPPLRPLSPLSKNNNRVYWGIGGIIIVIAVVAFLLFNRQPSITPLSTTTVTDTSTSVTAATPLAIATTAVSVAAVPTSTDTVQPSPTPTATPSLTASVAPSRTSTATVTASPTPTATWTITPSRTATSSPTPTATRTATVTRTPSPTLTATITPTPRPSATPTPLPDTVRFEFDRPLSGLGWSGTENSGSTTFIWMNDTSATLRLAVKTDRDLKLSIRIFYSIRDRVLQSLKLKVNGQTLLLTHQIGVTAPVIFTTIIPKTILAASPGLVQLEFDVQETVLAGSGDTRKLGVAFDWVMLEPIVAITPTPNSVSVILPGRIVFTSERNTNPEIFYMNPSQPSIPQRLTYNPAIDSHPALSQDGQWVAFNSNRDGNFKIYTMPINSLFQTMVTDNTDTNANPSWSPDGKQIAYNSTKSILSQIYVVDIGQKSSRLVSSSHNASDFNPAWSPKGNLIAIESNRSFSRDIYSICLNGLCLKNIVANTAFDGDPAWSPDGKQIAFTTNRDGNYEIYVVDASGANARRLTANPSRDEQPTWSPDGQYIAFVSDRSGNKDIWVMKAKDGSIVTNLTADSKADDYDPDWGVEPSK